MLWPGVLETRWYARVCPSFPDSVRPQLAAECLRQPALHSADALRSSALNLRDVADIACVGRPTRLVEKERGWLDQDDRHWAVVDDAAPHAAGQQRTKPCSTRPPDDHCGRRLLRRDPNDRVRSSVSGVDREWPRLETGAPGETRPFLGDGRRLAPRGDAHLLDQFLSHQSQRRLCEPAPELRATRRRARWRAAREERGRSVDGSRGTGRGAHRGARVNQTSRCSEQPSGMLVPMQSSISSRTCETAARPPTPGCEWSGRAISSTRRVPQMCLASLHRA
jgi:hypothetical protein